MQISDRGVAVIKGFEAFRAVAYQDVAGVWTIGYGSTTGVTRGQTITEPEADARLRRELLGYEAAVSDAAHQPLTQSQFDALVSFAYNVGPAGMAGSSVIKAHNRGDYQAAARAFALWNKVRVNGRLVPVAGLTRRRAAEAALYLQDQAAVESPATPEPVPERPMHTSEINIASTVAGGTAGAAAVAQSMATIKQSADTLGAWLVPVLLLAVVALCGYVIWQRVRQRRGGWA
ncbi:MAG: lysozyme [Burkholderiales bacterium]|nr:lysozyme [Burkholderiales bacterium]